MCDLRTALELIELVIFLVKFSDGLRPEIIESGKTKNRNNRANKKIKSLKEKFQLFYQAVCEVQYFQERVLTLKNQTTCNFD